MNKGTQSMAVWCSEINTKKDMCQQIPTAHLLFTQRYHLRFPHQQCRTHAIAHNNNLRISAEWSLSSSYVWHLEQVCFFVSDKSICVYICVYMLRIILSIHHLVFPSSCLSIILSYIVLPLVQFRLRCGMYCPGFTLMVMIPWMLFVLGF